MNLSHLSIGTIVFLIGAALYVIHLILSLAKKRDVIPFDGVGLMVLGIGLVLVLKL